MATPRKPAAPSSRTSASPRRPAPPRPSAAPAKASAAPHKNTAAPAKARAAPHKNTAAPAKASAAPRQAAAAASKAAAAPRKAASATPRPSSTPRRSGASLPREDSAARKARAARLLDGLRYLYPDADCELEHVDPFQLLVATILSAQTTDKAVNLVTPRLFARYPTPQALAQAEPGDVEPLIASIGLFRNKAKSLVGTARVLVQHFEGRVPREREDLESLPGVGRKTANVVLATAFRHPAFAVDTHVQRLAQLLGLSRHSDPSKIEKDLTELFPRDEWGFASHALIWHGRRVCVARAPRCADCELAADCPSVRFDAVARSRPAADITPERPAR